MCIDFNYNTKKGGVNMKISTRGRYAIRILLDIAMHQSAGFVSMKDVAERQQISKKYGDQIGMQLGQAGLLKAARGRNGGYMLVPSPEKITILQILEIVEGPISPVSCVLEGEKFCPRCTYCMTLPVWKGLTKAIEDYLNGVTLQDLIDQAAPQNDMQEASAGD